MLNYVKRQLQQKDKRVLVENVFSLSLLQLANYILPLITLPYLLRVLGLERYGLVAFAQAFVMYFQWLIDFGFDLSATREIALVSDDREKTSRIFFSVLFVKAALCVLSFVIFSALILVVGKFRSEQLLLLLTFMMLPGVVMFPTWFFQGMEKMKYVTILNVGAKFFFTVMIFVVIRSGDDYLYVPLLNALGFITAGAVGLGIAVKKYNLSIEGVSWKEIKARTTYSRQFFASRISISLFSNTNAFVIGLVLGARSVAYYVAAEKIYNALFMAIRPINDTLYPHMVKKRSISLFKKVFAVVCLANTVGWTFVFVYSGEIISLLFGAQYDMSAGVLRILSVAALFQIPHILLGFPFLGALGREKIANYSVIVGSCVHFALLVASIPFLSIYLVAALVILTHVIILAIRIYGVTRLLRDGAISILK